MTLGRRAQVRVNNACLETFGYSSALELKGQSVTLLMQSREAAVHHEFVERHEATEKRRVIGKPRAVIRRKKDGTRVPLTLSVSPCSQKKRLYIGILYRRMEAEARAMRRRSFRPRWKTLAYPWTQ